MPEYDQEPPRLPLAEAATCLGRSVDAVRAMIRRGKLATVRGNDGRLLVSVPPSLVQADAQVRLGDGEVSDQARLGTRPGDGEVTTRADFVNVWRDRFGAAGVG